MGYGQVAIKCDGRWVVTNRTWRFERRKNLIFNGRELTTARVSNNCRTIDAVDIQQNFDLFVWSATFVRKCPVLKESRITNPPKDLYLTINFILWKDISLNFRHKVALSSLHNSHICNYLFSGGHNDILCPRSRESFIQEDPQPSRSPNFNQLKD